MKLRLVALVAATTLTATLGLSACAQSNPTAKDCVEVSSGAASDSIKVSGEFGGTVTVSPPEAQKLDSVQRTVVTKGDGAIPQTGQRVDVMVSIFSGATGDRVDAVSTTLPANDETLADPVRAGIDCLAVGSRSVVVFPGANLYDAEQLQSIGLDPQEALILVVDVVAIKEDVKASEWSGTAPKVTFAADGTPTIDLAGSSAPSGVAVKVLKEGNGATVTAADTVQVNYLGVKWSDGSTFDGNFGQEPAEFALTGVIQGFKAALVGQKVGSQLLVSIPAASAYGTDPSKHQLGGQDLLFVIDITGVAASQ